MIRDDLWCLEHSQYLEDWGRYPFHVGPLCSALEDNMEDCLYNYREANKFQLIFIGTKNQCATQAAELGEFIQDKHKQDPKRPTGRT